MAVVSNALQNVHVCTYFKAYFQIQWQLNFKWHFTSIYITFDVFKNHSKMLKGKKLHLNIIFDTSQDMTSWLLSCTHLILWSHLSEQPLFHMYQHKQLTYFYMSRSHTVIYSAYLPVVFSLRYLTYSNFWLPGPIYFK